MEEIYRYHVIRRDGTIQKFRPDEILNRIVLFCQGLDKSVSADFIFLKVIAGMKDNMHTYQFDELAAEIAYYESARSHPDFEVFAKKIYVNNLHKRTCSSLLETYEKLRNDIWMGETCSRISDKFWEDIQKYHIKIQPLLNFENDYNFDYFGIKTLMKSYLLTTFDGVPVERPQHLFVRVAHTLYPNLDDPEEFRLFQNSLQLFSELACTHATPTLFNCGTPIQQLISCFLFGIHDSREGIMKGVTDCSAISKCSGGLGVYFGDLRACGSLIRKTGGKSGGITKFIHIYDTTLQAFDQGGGKRKGSCAVYIPTWHPDMHSVLRLFDKEGNDVGKARDLKYAIMLDDLFMERVESDSTWSFFCPDECPGLAEAYGDNFKRLYEEYEKRGKARSTMSAMGLMINLCEMKILTGQPYFLFKDAINKKSNQSNLGTIKNSNLCCEIVEFSSTEEYACCTLASISLPSCIVEINGVHQMDFERLEMITKQLVNNLDRVIDLSTYPVPEAEKSNKRHRNSGIGVQGLSDVFNLLHIPYTSPQARELNKRIFETIYLAAVEESVRLASKLGPYPSYYENGGCPASHGQLQFDLWGIKEEDLFYAERWKVAKEEMAKYGLRNSQLVALMPTATTSQLLGNTESFEPLTSNQYTRSTLQGQFLIVNKQLVKDLIKCNLWTEKVRKQISLNHGSIQNIDEIPQDLKEIYKTVYEISQIDLAKMCAERAPFICQTQSYNLFLPVGSTYRKVLRHTMDAWKLGLKTGSYYTHTQLAKYGANVIARSITNTDSPESEVCKPGCDSCSA